MITISTSKASWKQTKRMMDEHWPTWNVIGSQDLPLASHYEPYIDFWLEQESLDQEPRIFKKNEQWFQKLHLIEGIKS